MPQRASHGTMTVGGRIALGTADEHTLARLIVLDQRNATCTLRIGCPCEVDLDTVRTEADLFGWVLRLK